MVVVKNQHYHFISISGVAMHNIAIALHINGNRITGSDDGLFEPSRSKLMKYGLLPPEPGWFPKKINNEIDTVIVGMHTRPDNPELIESMKRKLRILSYPELLYELSKNKIRIVIAGSYGKSTITSMIVRAMQYAGIDTDFMVGAYYNESDVMAKFSESARYIVIEGDEYPSSPLDSRSKFLHYRPHIAVISGIGWDHAEVFPVPACHKEAFSQFIRVIEPEGTLFYNENEPEIASIADNNSVKIEPYGIAEHSTENGMPIIFDQERNTYPLKIFGEHNLANLGAARMVCREIGIPAPLFCRSLSEYQGIAKRLQLITKDDSSLIYHDFAHSPAEILAAVTALKKKYPEHKLVICYELHSYSSMCDSYIDRYRNTLDMTDVAIIFYDHRAADYKNIPLITHERIIHAFGKDSLVVFSDRFALVSFLKSQLNGSYILGLLTSGRFGEKDLKTFFSEIMQN